MKNSKEYQHQYYLKTKEYKRQYYLKNREQILAYQKTHSYRKSQEYAASQRRWTLRRYGMTNADYEKLLLAQDGRCAICKTSETGTKKYFDVDHNHITGKVRGLLCHVCNKYVGAFENARRFAVEEYLNARA